jgi:hypothetical protein
MDKFMNVAVLIMTPIRVRNDLQARVPGPWGTRSDETQAHSI